MAIDYITCFQVCRCVAEMHKLNIKPGHRFRKVVDILSIETELSREKCALAVEREINNGFVEWGIINSIGWLTSEGISILNKNLTANSASNSL